MSRPLIFLLGMPRSGTTWLGKIFDSHPDTLYLHEPDSIRFPSSIPLFADPAPSGRRREDLRSFIDQAVGMRATKVCGTLPIFRKSYLGAPAYAWRKYSVFLAKLGARAFGEFPVIDIGRGGRSGPVVWKSIESVGRAGLIARSLPDVRLIFELRHPCGYIASVLRGSRQRKFPGGGDVDSGIIRMLLETEAAKQRGMTFTALEQCSFVERLAWQWLLFNEKALREISGLDHCRILRYEDLCGDPVATTRSLMDFSGLRWSEQVKSFLEASTRLDTGSYYSVYKNPARAAVRWKEELSAEDVHKIMAIAGNSLPGSFYA